MSSTIRLSCISLTGRLNEETPLCVLEEVSRVHKIRHSDFNSVEEYYNYLVSQEYKRPIVNITPQTLEDRVESSFFLNPYTNWTDIGLKRALKNFRLFCSGGILPDPYFEIGMPTPSEPEKITVCMLYRICVENDFPLTKNITINNMASGILMSVIPSNKCRVFFRQQLKYIDDDQIPVLYFHLCNMIHEASPSLIKKLLENDYTPPSDDECTIDSIIDAYEFFHTQNKLSRVEPKTQGEAICLASMLYDADISMSSNILREYDYLRGCKQREQDWEPIDIDMRKTFRDNPLFFSIHHNFNPFLPRQLYSSIRLEKMALEEGFSEEDIEEEDPYSLLLTIYLSDTFYSGIQPSIKNKETPILLEPVDEIPNDCIICFGVRHDKLFAFRCQELADHFRIKRNFTNPLDGQELTAVSVEKLKRICHTVTVNSTEQGQQEKANLLRAINYTEMFTKEKFFSLKEFYIRYSSMSDSEKIIVKHVLNALFHVALCCRGWLNDKAPYPLEHCPVINQLEVDIRVTKKLLTYEKILELCPEETKQLINNLPLFSYSRGIFSIVSSENESVTLEKRLALLKEGEATSDYNSCMRLTSNVLAASVYKYFEFLEQPPPFDITKLRFIS